jgi:hypothetical protein
MWRERQEVPRVPPSTRPQTAAAQGRAAESGAHSASLPLGQPDSLAAARNSPPASPSACLPHSCSRAAAHQLHPLAAALRAPCIPTVTCRAHAVSHPRQRCQGLSPQKEVLWQKWEGTSRHRQVLLGAACLASEVLRLLRPVPLRASPGRQGLGLPGPVLRQRGPRCALQRPSCSRRSRALHVCCEAGCCEPNMGWRGWAFRCVGGMLPAAWAAALAGKGPVHWITWSLAV